jgi:hypothetical protein
MLQTHNSKREPYNGSLTSLLPMTVADGDLRSERSISGERRHRCEGSITSPAWEGVHAVGNKFRRGY